MPQDPKVTDPVAEAKKALAESNKKFPSAMASAITDAAKKNPSPMAEAMSKAKSAKPEQKTTGLAAELKAKKDNVEQYARETKKQGGSWLPEGAASNAMGAAPKMHDGGKVEEDGPKTLQKGETVLPKDKKKSEKLAMEHLGKKAGAMSAAVEEEKEEKAEKETPAEEKKEGKAGEKKEEKAEPKKEEKAEHGKKKHVGFHGHSHKAGHTVTHHFDDGSSETRHYALGEHAAMGSDIAAMVQSHGGEEPEGMPAAEEAPAQ